jgi:hypothetical protein
MATKTPYEILGISLDATEGEAKHTFRVLAKHHHPDRNPGDKEAEKRFLEVHDAWEAVKDILPKSAIPFPDIDPEDPGFEDAVAEWLIAMDAASAPSLAPAKTRKKETLDPSVWTTVAAGKSSSTGMVVRSAGDLADWRHQTIRRRKSGMGLEKITPEEAEQLITGRPNAFAALKLVQRIHPELCLYDAILERAQRSTSTALTILGAEDVDRKACTAALRDPLISVEVAEHNIEILAPFVKLAGKPINIRKLTFDLAFLHEAIEELVERIAERSAKK